MCYFSFFFFFLDNRKYQNIFFIFCVSQIFHSFAKDRLIKQKKGKRKVQGVPQSQTAALPRPQEEEETDKCKQAQTEQTYEKH